MKLTNEIDPGMNIDELNEYAIWYMANENPDSHIIPKSPFVAGGSIVDRSYDLILTIAIDILTDIRHSGKRISNLEFSEVKTDDGKYYYKVFWK